MFCHASRTKKKKEEKKIKIRNVAFGFSSVLLAAAAADNSPDGWLPAVSFRLVQDLKLEMIGEYLNLTR